MGISVFPESVSPGGDVSPLSAIGNWQGKMILGLVVLSFLVLFLEKHIRSSFLLGAVYSLFVLLPWMTGTSLVRSYNSFIPVLMVLTLSVFTLVMIFTKVKEKWTRFICILYVLVLIIAFSAQVGYLFGSNYVRETALADGYFYFYLEGAAVLGIQLYFLISGVKGKETDLFLRTGCGVMLLAAVWQYLTWSAEGRSSAISFIYGLEHGNMGVYLGIAGVLSLLAAAAIWIKERLAWKKSLDLENRE